MSFGFVPYGPGLNGTSGGVVSSHASSHVITPESGIDESGSCIGGLSEHAATKSKAHQRAIESFYISDGAPAGFSDAAVDVPRRGQIAHLQTRRRGNGQRTRAERLAEKLHARFVGRASALAIVACVTRRH